ncbi:MAG: hypothetical protein R3C52_09085 [Hyphomonadaceae bacterium]
MRFNPARLRPGPRVGVSLLFVLAFALVSSGLSIYLRATSPMPHIAMLSDKLDAVAENGDRYDTIFLGTSRTLYHVIPDEVEAAAAEAGCPGLGVFNFGFYGMTGSEQDWILNRLLETRSPRLKRIILEPPLPEYRSVGEILTDRSRFFHGLEDVPAASRSIWSYAESAPKRVFRSGIFALGVAYDLSGVGRLSTRFFPPPGNHQPSRMNLSEDGFEALDDVATADGEARRKDFLEHIAEVSDILARYGDPSPNIEARAAYMVAKMRRIEEAGVEPVLFVSPDIMEIDRTPQTGEAVRRQAPDLKVLNFNRPDVYPDLFDTSLWHDFSHFHRAGAKRLSHKIGAELCDAQTRTRTSDLHAVR